MQKILILLFLSSSLQAQVNVAPGDVIEPSIINSLQSQVTAIKNSLKKQSLYKEEVLWTGNTYIDGAGTYNLWSASYHKAWDSLDLYFGYDSNSNPVIHRIDLGPGYSYGNTALAYQTLLQPYWEVYRRIIITTTGIRAINGGGANVFYLRKVVGRTKTILPTE